MIDIKSMETRVVIYTGRYFGGQLIPIIQSSEDEVGIKYPLKYLMVKVNTLTSFMSLLEDVWEPEVRANPEERAKREVKKYTCIDIDPDQKPLLWWKQYSSQLPVLSKLAHKYLCIYH